MSTRSKEWTGRHVLIAMIAFFSVVIATNTAFAILATRTFPGEDVPRSYLQGLHYNQTLAERAAAAELGWKVRVERPAADTIVLVFRDRRGAPLTGLALDAGFRHPASADADQALSFHETAPGRYVAGVRRTAGELILRGTASRDGATLEFERRLAWRSSPTR